MTAEEIATKDIKDDLRQHSKCFIAFKKNLDSVMEELVEQYPEKKEIIPKFKVGDTIVPKIPNKGVEAVITRIDSKSYYLRILCGTAIIPIKSQETYKLKTDK